MLTTSSRGYSSLPNLQSAPSVAAPIGKTIGPSSIASAAPSFETTYPNFEKWQRTADAFDVVKQSMATSGQDAKDQAKARLEQAKQQLEMLERWSFPAEIIERLASQWGQDVSTAAGAFASAAYADGGGAAPTPAAGEPASGTAQGPADGPSGKPGGTTAEEPRSVKTDLPSAYRDVLNAHEGTDLSNDERGTMAEFASVARRIAVLLEKALRELREEARSRAEGGQDGSDALNATSINAGGLHRHPE